MKAAVLHEVGKPLSIEDVTIADPGPFEVRIRTTATGVCHSDLHFIEGTWPHMLPVVLGHESAGVVEAVGDMVEHCKPGDHVITCLSAFCGHCNVCLSGSPNLCGGRSTMRKKGEPARLSIGDDTVFQFAHLSGFAEEMLVHENALVKVREDMPLDKAALIGCGVMTGVGAVFRSAAVEPGSTVAVIGCGGIGLSAINGAQMAGAGRIIAVDLVPSKLELAKKFGATDVVNAGEVDAVAAVQEMTSGGVDYSFEAIGLPLTAHQAWSMLHNHGTATVIGMLPVGSKLEIAGQDLLSERKLQGCIMGSNRFRIDMPRFCDAYLAGRLKLDDLLSRHITLEEVNGAFDEMKQGEVARQVIQFD